MEILDQQYGNLESFAESIQPTWDYNHATGELVDLLVKFLQQDLPYKVDRVVKSGSFGKGTQVRSSADLDCVLVLNCFSNVEDRKIKGDKVMDSIQSKLARMPWATGVQTDNYLVKFTMRKNNVKIDVDLLPTFEVLGHYPPSRGTLDRIYSELLQLDGYTRSFYSAPLCQLQLEFVRSKPARVKTLIRIVKYWSKEEVGRQSHYGRRYPKSYPMELLCIHVWEKAGRPQAFNMAVAFKAVLKRLVCYSNMEIIWDDNYSRGFAVLARALMSMNTPILLDPANPTNNVMSASDPSAWEHVASIARASMDRPLLKTVNLPFSWDV